jgi:DNA-binding response OmpR family regulator
MGAVGSLLIVDDEDTFRESTCRLLRREGFDCHAAKDADEAVANLRRRRFDLLVADIRMPRNPDLRVIREARALDSQMPVILVTGYPSVETAVRSVEMSVVAYLTKPLDFDELVPRVLTAVEQSRDRRTLAAVRQRLASCVADLEAVPSNRLPRNGETDGLVSIATIRTLASCLSELLDLTARSGADWGSHNLCELLDCSQRPIHRQAILKAIGVLKKTKDTFKSKQLAELRTELERLLEHGSIGQAASWDPGLDQVPAKKSGGSCCEE